MNQEQDDICNEFPRDNLKNIGNVLIKIKNNSPYYFKLLRDVLLMQLTIMIGSLINSYMKIGWFIIIIAAITIVYYEKEPPFLKSYFKLIYVFLEPLFLIFYYVFWAIRYIDREMYCNSGKWEKGHFILHNILTKNLSYSMSLSNYIMNAYLIFYGFFFYHSTSNALVKVVITIFIHNILFLTITRLTFSSRDEDKIIVSKCKICKRFLVTPIIMVTGCLGALTTIASFILPNISITLSSILNIFHLYNIDIAFEKYMQFSGIILLIPTLYVILYPVIFSFFIACKLLDILSPIFYGEILDKPDDQDE